MIRHLSSVLLITLCALHPMQSIAGTRAAFDHIFDASDVSEWKHRQINTISIYAEECNGFAKFVQNKLSSSARIFVPWCDIQPRDKRANFGGHVYFKDIVPNDGELIARAGVMGYENCKRTKDLIQSLRIAGVNAYFSAQCTHNSRPVDEVEYVAPPPGIVYQYNLNIWFRVGSQG
jgi:hypothetical protein